MISYIGKTFLDLDVNGRTVSVAVQPSDTLLHVLRAGLGLTGAKPGCENGDCGACTVLVDDMPIKSCLMLAVEAVGHRITTIEGLKDAPIQAAFVQNWGFQCGYCTSGFLMVCHSLALHHPDADDALTETWLQSNLCRCTGYAEIRDAVKSILAPKPGTDP